MIRRPPRSTRTDTRFPYTTLFRSLRVLFTGTIDSSSPNPLAGEDGYQNIPLATDTLSVSFRISDSYLVDIGGGTSIAGVYHDPDGSMTIDAAPFAYDKYSDVLDGGGIVYDSYEIGRAHV